MDVFPSVYNILFIDERILEYLTDLKKNQLVSSIQVHCIFLTKQ